MAETQDSGNMSTKRPRIAQLAKERPDFRFNSLNQLLDLDALRQAYYLLRVDAKPGIDGQTWHDYGTKLEDNLRDLLERAKSGRYRAPPLRRVYIPKDGAPGETRPLGIPTVEDKLLQRAVAGILELVYEQDFMPCSYGFRPGRTARQAREAVWQATTTFGTWVLEGDIRKRFDTLGHKELMAFLGQRIGDGVLLRLIGKWLNAGVLEDGALTHPTEGTPQGGAISPLLANVFLHYVLDKWFAQDVLPRMHGRADLIRYADDFVLVFELEADARRVLDVLPKRFAKHGLALHPEKTRLVRFGRPPRDAEPSRDERPGTFDFLGFAHHWKKARKGTWAVGWRTAASRLRRTLVRALQWCRAHRHEPTDQQQKILAAKLHGHYAYFGVTGNFEALARLHRGLLRTWKYWLARRGAPAATTWPAWRRFLEAHPLPRPRIV